MKKLISLFITLLLCAQASFAQGSATLPNGFPQDTQPGQADNNANYVLIGPYTGSTLQNYRTIQLGTGLTPTDNGSKNTFVINLAAPLQYLSGLGFTTQQGFANAVLNFPSSAAGDIYYNNGTNITRLPIGSSSQVLSVVSGLPAWITGGSGAPATPTYITKANETASLPNSLQLLNGSGITLTPGTNTDTIGIDTTVVDTLTGTQTLTNKTLTIPTFSWNAGAGAFKMAGSTFTSTIKGADWTAARTLSIPEPGNATANFVLDQGASTIVSQKTFTASPILSTNTITTSSGNAVTFPNSADTLVNLSSTQSLNNKTLNSPIIASPGITLQQTTANYSVAWANPAAARTYTFRDVGVNADIAMRGASAAYTSGGVVYCDGNVDQVTAAGSSGNLLMSNGPGAAPTWTANTSTDRTGLIGGKSNLRPLPTSGAITGDYYTSGAWTQTGAITSTNARCYFGSTVTINNTWTVNTEALGGVGGSGTSSLIAQGGNGAGYGGGVGGVQLGTSTGGTGGAGGGFGGAGGGAGSSTATVSGSGSPTYPISMSLSGSGGGAGRGGTSLAGGPGGNGGGSLYIEAIGNISVTASGAITATGGPGGIAGATGTSGGGGSGGGIEFRTLGTVTIATGGTITANGGNGGNIGTIAGPGGGGGGGIVDIAGSTVTNNGTVSANGGAAGTGGTTAATAGGLGSVTLTSTVFGPRSAP